MTQQKSGAHLQEGRKTRNRLALAAALDARLPQTRGRDRLLQLIRGNAVPSVLHSDMVLRWGPGLEATVNPSLDGSLRALYLAQWVRPALVPLLQAFLKPGDLFVDVGANVGLYATWGGKIVGPTGAVLAMEPVPHTRIWLEQISAQNRLSNVEVIPMAAGEEEGSAWMQTTDGASGLSRIVAGAETGIQVSITTLDRLLGCRVPALIKIDVEGHELAVLRGARRTLETTRAPVTFEAPDFGVRDGPLDCVQLLESIGYRVFSLTPRGVRTFDPVAHSHNLLALDAADRTIEDRLRGARFPRSQNT